MSKKNLAAAVVVSVVVGAASGAAAADQGLSLPEAVIAGSAISSMAATAASKRDE